MPKCNPCNTRAKENYFNISGTIYPKYIPSYLNKSLNFDCINKDNNSKVILSWTSWFGSHNFGLGNGKTKPFIETRCPLTNCELTDDKSRLDDSDMIIFDLGDSLYPLPSFRYTHQRWVFLRMESPAHSDDYTEYNGIFNTSSTYKQNTDFNSFYYGESGLIWEENEQYDLKKNFSANKSGFAAAIISNCNAQSKRLKLIEELKKYFRVDLFGKCGKTCPNADKSDAYTTCKKLIAHSYKFYFAFENSLCADYVTEKFFFMLKYDIILVVYGLGNYDFYVPKEAYINVLDFESIPRLAEYLLYLDNNSTAYDEYFTWKRFIKFKDHPASSTLCEMCIQLNMQLYEPMRPSVITDFGEYFNRKKDCLNIDFGRNLEFITSKQRK